MVGPAITLHMSTTRTPCSHAWLGLGLELGLESGLGLVLGLGLRLGLGLGLGLRRDESSECIP